MATITATPFNGHLHKGTCLGTDSFREVRWLIAYPIQRGSIPNSDDFYLEHPQGHVI
jgi:hypothetical protein